MGAADRVGETINSAASSIFGDPENTLEMDQRKRIAGIAGAFTSGGVAGVLSTPFDVMRAAKQKSAGELGEKVPSYTQIYRNMIFAEKEKSSSITDTTKKGLPLLKNVPKALIGGIVPRALVVGTYIVFVREGKRFFEK